MISIAFYEFELYKNWHQHLWDSITNMLSVAFTSFNSSLTSINYLKLHHKYAKYSILRKRMIYTQIITFRR